MSELNGVNINTMKLEYRLVDYDRKPALKPPRGARFARVMGSILGPLGLAASVFFPPAAIGGLAAYGMKRQAETAIAQHHAYSAAERAQTQSRGPKQVQFVGFEATRPMGQPGGRGIASPAAYPRDAVTDILFSRHDLNMANMPR